MITNIYNHLPKIFSLLVAMIFSGTLMAQMPIWENDFSSGDFPVGWTTGDLSGGNAAWTWCDDPIDSQGAGCIGNWTLYNAQHGDTFNATSAANGFVLFDSDGLGAVSPEHQATITTPTLDFTGTTDVYLKFESLIGVWEFPTQDNAVVRVSTDGFTTFTEYNIVKIRQGMLGNNPEFFRWTVNPEITVIDISAAVAGNPANVQIQWFWRGSFEYYWLLDDVAVYDEDVRDVFLEKYDARVTDFFAGAPNAMTPVGQSTEFGFLADIYNSGYETLNDVSLKAEVLDGSGTSIFSEDLAYGTITPDSLAENQLFTSSFALPNTVGDYTVRYTVSSAETETNPDDNVKEFPAMITENTFSKELAPNTSFEPIQGTNNAPWASNTEPKGWTLANYYQMIDATDKYAKSVTFGIGNPEELANKVILVYLWEFTNNGDTLAANDELVNIGLANYVVTGNEVANELITVDLESTGAPGDIALKDNQAYLVGVAYTANDGEDFSAAFSVNDEVSYSARVFGDNQNGQPRYFGPFAGFGNGVGDIDIIAGNWFGDDYAPTIRLEIGPGTVSTENIYSDLEFSLTPNISTDFVNINIDLDNSFSGQIKVVDINGKTVELMQRNNLDNQQIQLDVNNYPAGNYFLNLTTKEGTATRKFTVVK